MARQPKKPFLFVLTTPFIQIEHALLKSEAYKGLSFSSKAVFQYFVMNIKIMDGAETTLTFEQAKKAGVANSPSTFLKNKKEFVERGLLDPVDPGGGGRHAIFDRSQRWRHFGSANFKKVKYKSGIGRKQFIEAWKDPKKRKELLKSRRKRKKSHTENGGTSYSK